MRKSSCRYIIQALGKRGETYHSHCKDKEEVRKWIAEHADRISMRDVKVVDNKRHPLLKWIAPRI